jgi:hypothetical protein
VRSQNRVDFSQNGSIIEVLENDIPDWNKNSV